VTANQEILRPVKDITDKNFGVIIAFLLPGFVLLWGLSFSNTGISRWLTEASAPSIGGFLYATLASLALGLLISAVRWLIVDRFLKYVTALPEINFAKLKEDAETFAVFQGIIENHYRYYQYYSNTFVAVIIAFVAYLVFGNSRPSVWLWLAVILLGITLLLASRDSLHKYHVRASQIST